MGSTSSDKNDRNGDNSSNSVVASFSNWVQNKLDWDEYCLQLCKQQEGARQKNNDADCSMICLKRGASKSNNDTTRDSRHGDWNPLQGVRVAFLKGKEECTTHVNDMKSDNEETRTAENTETKYTVDLGNLFKDANKQEAKVTSLATERVLPVYNSILKQADEWLDQPNMLGSLEDYVKSKASQALKQIYPKSATTSDDTSSKNSSAGSNPNDKDDR